MFVSKKFIVLFLASLIGFTLGFRFTQTTLAAKPSVIQSQRIAVVHKSVPISHRAEGNSS
jgi:hypothetical protein